MYKPTDTKLSSIPRPSKVRRNKRRRDRSLSRSGARLRLRLKNIDNIEYCRYDTHSRVPIFAEIQFTAVVALDEDSSVSNYQPNYSLFHSPVAPNLESESTTDLKAPPQEGTEWVGRLDSLDYLQVSEHVPKRDPDLPHSWIDIYSFDSPATLEKYIAQIDQLYASVFPGCRHLQFFVTEKDVMYHIVEEHITPTQKQFVCTNCGVEFDHSEEADEHFIMNNTLKDSLTADPTSAGVKLEAVDAFGLEAVSSIGTQTSSC